jgi:hypothetical protein
MHRDFRVARRLLARGTMDDRRRDARRRALRAARVVTLAAALALGPACGSSHTRGPDPERDAAMADASMPPPDASPRDSGPGDSGPPDARVADAHVPVDAGGCPPSTFTDCCEPMPEECCIPGYWDESLECCVTCVEGPMVPPSAPV